MKNEFKDYDWLISTYKIRRDIQVKEKLEELINYCRYQQKLYNEGYRIPSGNDILSALLQDGYLKMSLVIQIKPLIDDLTLDYELTLDNGD